MIMSATISLWATIDFRNTWNEWLALIVLNLLFGDSLFGDRLVVTSSAAGWVLVSMTSSGGVWVGVGDRTGVLGVWTGVGVETLVGVGAGETILFLLGWGTWWGTLLSAFFVGDRSLMGGITGWGGSLMIADFGLSMVSSGPGRESCLPSRLASKNWKVWAL